MDNTGELWAQVLFRIGDLHKLRDELDGMIKELTQLAFDAQCSIAGVVPRKSQEEIDLRPDPGTFGHGGKG
ncbi:unnamed protein product [marine sediment metagenome]|uniref:Uncharacterized protein n=1 Tax=marine sediment metagenome TaxID=412755 RepID=X0SX85_9ZZZZ